MAPPWKLGGGGELMAMLWLLVSLSSSLISWLLMLMIYFVKHYVDFVGDEENSETAFCWFELVGDS